MAQSADGFSAARLAPAVPAVLIVAGLLLRLRLAAGPVTVAVPDDAFYDFGVARNMALGLPPSIDGVHATNGYHPLWVAILAVIYRIAGTTDVELPIRVARGLGGVFDVLGVWVTHRWLEELGVRRTLRIAAVAWLALNPFAVEQATNGLETSLAVLFLALTSIYHSRALSRRMGPEFPIFSGVLIGFTVLSRTELIVPCLGWLLAAARRNGSLRASLPLLATSLGIAAVILGPWVAYSLLTTGTLVQSSATAMMFVFWKTPLVGGLSHVSPAVALERAAHSFRDGLDLVGEYLGTGLGLGCILFGASAVLALTRTGDPRRRLRQQFRKILPLLGSLGALFVLFTTVRLYFETWHTAPFVWAVVLCFVLAVDACTSRPWSDAVAGGAVVGILALATWTLPHRVPWNLSAGSPERGARTDCGADAYMAPRSVVNVDGVVNNAALSALRAGQLLRYVKAVRPDYLYLDYYFHSSVFFGPRYREELVTRDESAPAILALATPEQKDARLHVGNEPLRPNTARGREVLSDGWLWDPLAATAGVRSVGTFSELVAVLPNERKGRRLRLELSALVVSGPRQTQEVLLTVDGASPRHIELSQQTAWYDVDAPFDGRRHRIRLEYQNPELRVERAPGVRWWWRTLGYQVNAAIYWGMRLDG